MTYISATDIIFESSEACFYIPIVPLFTVSSNETRLYALLSNSEIRVNDFETIIKPPGYIHEFNIFFDEFRFTYAKRTVEEEELIPYGKNNLVLMLMGDKESITEMLDESLNLTILNKHNEFMVLTNEQKNTILNEFILKSHSL